MQKRGKSSKCETKAGGYSLTELMLALGLVATISLAIASTNFQMAASVSKAAAMSRVDLFRRSLVSLVGNSQSWAETVNAPVNAAIKTCLTSWSASCPGEGNALPLSLFDASGALFYDARNANNGFTALGMPCGPGARTAPYNTPAYYYGGANCPYKYDLRWYAIPNGSSGPPVIGVKGRLVMIPNYDTHFDVSRYRIPTIHRPAN